ncbi:MAG: rRNA pseudouridine synthase [Verrucomicrobia bacterium]|nr:MAG: rRNA pseudouridine synthase [Verrucomicrobiota bacterium]
MPIAGPVPQSAFRVSGAVAFFPMPLVRLQKILAEAGVASRRAAEKLIVDGHVTVDGAVIDTLGAKVDPDAVEVAVDGRPVRARKKLYVALHKPPGFLCTRTDPEDRQTVLELLPKEWSNLYPVGRLDRESEGLIFLTNDGDFSLRLTHPRFGVRKKYIAHVEGRIDQPALASFTEGVEDAGEVLKAERARLISANNSHSVVELELAQGKNREVRRLFAALGLEVVTLRRTQIGPIRLAELPAGKWRILSPAEVKSLLPARD